MCIVSDEMAGFFYDWLSAKVIYDLVGIGYRDLVFVFMPMGSNRRAFYIQPGMVIAYPDPD
jgi:hypothetical protein